MSGDPVPVGRVGRPHGLDGAFVVERGSDDPDRYGVGEVILVDGEPAEIVLSRRVGRSRRAIKLDRPVERGQQLSVACERLPPPDPGTYYVYQLVGLAAVTEAGGAVGTVEDILPGIANDNLQLSGGLLVPMIEDAVLEIDLEAGRVVLSSNFVET